MDIRIVLLCSSAAFVPVSLRFSSQGTPTPPPPTPGHEGSPVTFPRRHPGQ